MSKKRIKIETEHDEAQNHDESEETETAGEIEDTEADDATISADDVSERVVGTEDKSASLAEMTENWQRERANFLNFKRRVEEEKEKLRKYAHFDFAFDLLRVVDYFESSISFGENLPESAKNVILGVEYTLRELTQVLSAHGVKPIEVKVGDEYDSTVMEAVERREAPDDDPDTVLEIQRTGWRLYDRVLRAVQVVVAGRGVDSEDENGEGGDIK